MTKVTTQKPIKEISQEFVSSVIWHKNTEAMPKINKCYLIAAKGTVIYAEYCENYERGWIVCNITNNTIIYTDQYDAWAELPQVPISLQEPIILSKEEIIWYSPTVMPKVDGWYLVKYDTCKGTYKLVTDYFYTNSGTWQVLAMPGVLAWSDLFIKRELTN